MSNNYASITAGLLRRIIDESDTCELPSFTDIARQLNVSRTTVAKAAKILKKEGILSGRQGQRFLIIRAKNIADKKPVLRAEEKATAALREYIRTFQGHEPVRIPVMDLVKKVGFSYRTVTNALHGLVKEGVVKKYGRYYMVAQEQE